jgi:hypothetical protein
MGRVVRTPLAESTKVKGAAGRTLGLARIQKGVLTYTVKTGSVSVMSGPADAATVVRKIGAGKTGKIRARQWIVEQPSTVHQAANNGSGPILIYVATLLESDAPPSTPKPSGR